MSKPTKTSDSTVKLATVSFILRMGLALVFAYAALDAFKTPDAWIGFVPSQVSHFMSTKLALDLLSVAQLVIVFALLLGQYVKYAAVLSFLFLVGLMVSNPGTFLITFRDIGLAFMAVAVYYIEK